jgi:AraC family transcriptional regulator
MFSTEFLKPCLRASTVESRCRAVERVITSMHRQMDEQKDDPLSLHELAEIAILSPYHFNRVFRQVTGIPPTQFQYALRLEAAKRLLLTTNLSVTDVCFEVGYNSLGTFTMRFTKLVGLPPRILRHLARNFDPSAQRSLLTRQTYPRPVLLEAGTGNVVRGRVEVPDGFEGPIFVGLFDALIPQGPPRACTLLTTPGDYQLAPVPDGEWHLFATGLSWTEDTLAYLLCDTALRAHAGPVTVRNGDVTGEMHLSLRAPQLTDPPILIALPLLFAGRNAQSVGH